MAKPLAEMIDFLDELLDTHRIKDGSRNGLQVEGSSDVSRVCFAVDACEESARKTAEDGAQLLIVHHGLFWSSYTPVSGRTKRIVKYLLDGGVSLYASHLPLDSHPDVGNNAVLCGLLGVRDAAPFGQEGVGYVGELSEAIPLEDLAARFHEVVDSAGQIQAFGPAQVKRIAVVSGGGTGFLQEAVDAGADCLVTGETRHQAYWEARDLGINVLFAGHYATETLGLKALSQLLSERFQVETCFLDLPTGL